MGPVVRPTLDSVRVSPHGWGLYKFQHAGLIHGYEGEAEAWALGGEKLAAVEERFYETYHPDMFHLGTGAVRAGGPASRAAERAREVARLLPELRRLDSIAVIDEFVDLVSPPEEEILSSGIFDHVRFLAEAHGREHFIAVNEGNPICVVLDPQGWLGFENGLTLMVERPDAFARLVAGAYAGLLPRMRALAASGAHGYIGSETYCAADLISPAMYRSLIHPALAAFYQALPGLGLTPMVYFLGDVTPLIPDLRGLGAEALLVEEPKKGFDLDVVELARGLEGSLRLFGNLDSIWCLQRGTTDSVRREAERQLAACRYGPFVLANGSPIAFDTPPKNIHTMIGAART